MIEENFMKNFFAGLQNLFDAGMVFCRFFRKVVVKNFQLACFVEKD